MTNLSVHTELLHKGAADPLTRGLLPATLIVGGVLAAALIGTSFGTPQSGSIGETVAAEAPAVATLKIVPADALGTHTSWSPLVGDGSN